MSASLEDILQYIERVGSSDSDLRNHIFVVRPKEPIPNIKDYGLRVYFGEDGWLSNKREKIGPIITQYYEINTDLVFNRQLTSRQVFSNSKGISYWESVMTTLFANSTNSGLFRDSYWTPNGNMEQNDESTILKGILHVVVDTHYQEI